MTPAEYPAGGSPARKCQVSPPGSVAQAVLRSTPDVSPPSDLAAMDQYSPWSASLQVGETADSPLLPAPLTPRRMVEGKVGHRRSLATWGGVSRNLRGCMRQLSSVSVRVGRVVVYTVEYGSSVICIGTWQDFIWTWPSCGGAQCSGAPSGRARPRTAWITFEERMMFRGRSSRPA